MEKAVKFRTIMNEPYRDHPSEDALERFLLNQSDEEELEIVETHIMACESCVTRLESLELNIAATKLAIKNKLAEQEVRVVQPVAAKSRTSWFAWLTMPRLSFAGAGLAACALALTFISVPRDVTLVAERGNETTAVSEYVPLHLHLQARDMDPGPVTVEMVDQAGKQVWQTESAVKDQLIDVKAPRLTASGSYFIRVYTPTAGDAIGNLIREYSIKAKPGL